MSFNGLKFKGNLTGWPDKAAAKLPSYRVAMVLSLMLGLSLGCASKLEKDKADRIERGEGKAIDISQLFFTDLESGASVDLRSFMEQESKEYVLMVFGSMSCSSCNHKNEYLRDDVIGKHELYTDDRGRAFELVGVNTDVERLRPSEQLFKSEKHFDFIRTQRN